MKLSPTDEKDPAGRRVMVKASDDHIIEAFDSIDVKCKTPHGVVLAPQLACNFLAGAFVGKKTGPCNRSGHQVWKPTWMKEDLR